MIVDGERKSCGEHPVVAEMLGVDARVQVWRVNVRKEGVQKVVPKPFRLGLVEPKAVNEVLFGHIEDQDLHFARPRILRLASVQSPYLETPS